MEIIEDAIILSSQLGVRIIQLAELAAREGVILAFETIETPFLNTVKKAMSWIEKIQSSYLQVYPDVGNLTNAAILCGTDVCEDLTSGQGHLAAVHLKKTKPGIYREVPYGTGHVDFANIAATARKQRKNRSD